jgi:hypothetical protein
VAVRADPAVFRGRRFGNVVLAASAGQLPIDELTRAASSAMFPQRVLAGSQLAGFAGKAPLLTDEDQMRSPAPPDDLWRVQ